MEQTKYQKAFQDWAKLRAPQVSFYSQSLQAQLLPQLMTYAELPWTKQFRVMEHINAKMLPNTSQETQRATNVEYKAFIQACCGQAQVITSYVQLCFRMILCLYPYILHRCSDYPRRSFQRLGRCTLGIVARSTARHGD